MSKWMKDKTELFKKFKEEKNAEKENSGINRSEMVWKTPEKGTAENPKTYILRLLMDVNDDFYRTMSYHMFYSTANEKWVFILCNKTFNFTNYCPLCAAVSKLYTGSSEDKKVAYNFKRKVKHCCNAYISKDPRDADKIEEEKSEGKVYIYEFPTKVESKIKGEMNDSEYGAGMNLFDPGKDGFDFILKVGATKPMQEGANKGKSFPDYGDSKFANRPSAIADSDDVIETAMEGRHDLTKYLDSMVKDDDYVIDILKKEMLYDLVKTEVESRMKLKDPSYLVQQEVVDTPDTSSTETSVEQEPDSNVSDLELIKELDELDSL